ncbi:metallophosphoesterase family protein [Sediminicola luteus]|uniref:Calcineurin-like phosphoesterase domain-containing protein n=1 Tax=Sediminicola luteus TaxID=319238 RepID=A0A2A4GE91_9FLAO|nr:metallophosphoesterase [Sediminicola luteus]PCE66115.1 hypothetical protein B7P33_02105 [Sediminicola luteus]
MKTIRLKWCCLAFMGILYLGTAQRTTGFSFAFLTDIHLQPERGAQKAFKKAIDSINALEIDMVVTGGDLVYDVLRGDSVRSNQLFQDYLKMSEQIQVPVKNTIGNHELYGIYPESDVSEDHPDYYYGLYERYMGPTYHSFDHKGWRFISVNSIMKGNGKYIGKVDDKQFEWLAQLALKTPHDMSLVLVTHIPFLTTHPQRYGRGVPTTPNNLWIENGQAVLRLFEKHNLRLVLQGHLHWIEDIELHGKTRFLTGGSLAGRPSWRRGSRKNNGIHYDEEGFMVVHISGEEIDWEYIDIGWEAQLDE